MTRRASLPASPVVSPFAPAPTLRAPAPTLRAPAPTLRAPALAPRPARWLAWAFSLPLALAGCSKSSGDWLVDLRSDEPFTRRLAVAGLGAQGDPNALPALIDALDDTDEEVARSASAAIASIGAAAVTPLLAGLRPDAGTAARERSVRALAAVGGPAVPALVEALREGAPAFDADAVTATLGRIGAPAAHPLSVLLGDVDPGIAARAARALAANGPAAAAALDALALALGNPDATVRRESALAVRAIDASHEAALLALVRGARDPDPAAREAILLAGVSGLLVRMRDDNGLRAHAAEVQIETLGTAALPALAAALREVDAAASEDLPPGQVDPALAAPARCLAALGPSALPALFQQLNPANPVQVERAGLVVADVGPDALPVLRAMIDDERHPRRLMAIATVAKAGPPAEVVRGQLLSFLHEKDTMLRVAAAYALSNLPDPGDTGLARLLTEAGRQDTMTRRALMPGIVRELVERIAHRPDEADVWRGRLTDLGADAWGPLDALAKGPDAELAPVARAAMDALSGRVP